jgi:hypothetical protein
MFIKFVIWLLNKVFNGKNRVKVEPTIKELYRVMAKDNLILRSQIINVKKGKRKYDLLVFETPKGNIKVNLGRHWDKETIEFKNGTATIAAEMVDKLEFS